MSTIWNPQKNIPLYQTRDFPALWKSIIDKPPPGMIVGTGWLTPQWINFRGHNEKEYQECIIYHWPREIVPHGITEKDKLSNLLPDIKKLIGQAIEAAAAAYKIPIKAATVESVINLCYQVFLNLTSGPVGGLPLLNLLNMDGGLTFIYAHWYEGTPSKFQWVMDVNWDRYNRLRVFNQQVQQLEVDSNVTKNIQNLEYNPQRSLSSTADDKIMTTDDSTFSQRFSSAMSSQGLPVPSSLFGTITTAVATINSIYSLVSTYGTSITLAELIGAGLLSDALLVAGSMTAAYYLGACIGCGIYAGIGHLIPGA